jgi:trans-aconitate methyltransferase
MIDHTIDHPWDAKRYENQCQFVWQYGEDLLPLLAAKPGDRILDLGCGTGQLTDLIARSGAETLGLDASATMIEAAQQQFPHLKFITADARHFQVEQPLDAVFSNAALHWIPEADAVIHSLHQALKPGGRFVAEFGGQGNVQGITTALTEILTETGRSVDNPWFFPSIGDYTGRLERHGFQVTYARLYDRPTPLTGAEAGLADWVEMFGSRLLADLSGSDRSQVLRSLEQRLRATHYRDHTWIADYRRIQVLAFKLGE